MADDLQARVIRYSGDRCALCSKKGHDAIVRVVPESDVEHAGAYRPVHAACEERRQRGEIAWNHVTVVDATFWHNQKHPEAKIPYPPRPDSVTQ